MSDIKTVTVELKETGEKTTYNIKDEVARDTLDGIIDHTLTQTGKAADAKETGDRFESIKTAYYPGLAVGAAETILADTGVVDKVPYLFRQSGGGVTVGDREKDTVVGATVSWNQLCNGSSVTALSGHKCLTKIGSTWAAITSTGAAITGLTSGSSMVIDLTTLFGPTIADHIYQLEQSTAGAGVAFFRKLFPKDYYPYCEPTLMSAKPTSHDMVGFNQWDEEWEVGDISASSGKNSVSSEIWRTTNYIRVIPNAVYYIYSPTANSKLVGARFYDANKNYIGYSDQNGGQVSTGSTFVAPSNAHFVRIAPKISDIPNHDICINLSWSGYRNGEYEPYKKHSYPLGGEELRGILKLDSANNLYAYGDRYTPDGLIERRFALVDLGTLNYSFERSDDGNRMFTSYLSGRIKKSNGMMNLISTRFYAVSRLETLYQTDGGMWVSEAGNVSFSSGDYSDVADFKAAMSGVMLLYELAEPTTETSVPYSEVQIVDDFGTEEYVDSRTVPIPVGHETTYPTPIATIPEPPDTAGTYTLRAVVSASGTTYEWISG